MRSFLLTEDIAAGLGGQLEAHSKFREQSGLGPDRVVVDTIKAVATALNVEKVPGTEGKFRGCSPARTESGLTEAHSNRYFPERLNAAIQGVRRQVEATLMSMQCGETVNMKKVDLTLGAIAATFGVNYEPLELRN
jgi:hypothetical protein